ncbi:MAG: hypothetical protein ISR65_02415 [Bacteriovoracaceae bacterium]|nr:hypothetical protein [Bacteriovoracaceae bacterium]
MIKTLAVIFLLLITTQNCLGSVDWASRYLLNPKELEDILDFRSKIQLHIVRVSLLGLELVRLHPQIFKGIDTKKLKSFLELHDKAKLIPPRLDWISGDPDHYRFFLLDLWNIQHRHYSDLTDSELIYFQRVLKELNALKKDYAVNFFREHKMLEASSNKPNAMAKLFLLIERIANLVDKGMDVSASTEPNENILAASEILKDTQSVKLARSLEDHYSQIVTLKNEFILNNFFNKKDECFDALNLMLFPERSPIH